MKEENSEEENSEKENVENMIGKKKKRSLQKKRKILVSIEDGNIEKFQLFRLHW